MIRLIAFTLTASCATSCVAASDTMLPTVVLRQDLHFTAGTLPRGDGWQGLRCDDRGCDLRNLTLQVDAGTAINVADEHESIDVLHGGEDQLALLHGLHLPSGPVATWYRFDGEAFESDPFLALLEQTRWTLPGHSATLTLLRVDQPGGHDFDYIATNGTAQQHLFTVSWDYQDAPIPVLHWVGDLNRDGRPDLLIRLPDADCSYDDRLYLSTSDALQPWTLAARLTGWQAACGC